MNLLIEMMDDDDDNKCKNIECSLVDYYTKELKCPEDTIQVDATPMYYTVFIW